jgi:hypothetical protein
VNIWAEFCVGRATVNETLIALGWLIVGENLGRAA